MLTTCFIVGLVILAISICFAIKNRHSTQKWIANITVGIFFSTLFMIFPTYYYAESGYKGIYHALYAIASSLFYSFKALAGRADLSQLENIVFEGNMRNAYIVVNYIAFITAPVMASSLLLSFFGDTLQRIRYSFRFFGKCCIFSELNENSITLSQSIKNEKGRETIVFCNTKDVDTDLVNRARQMGGILLHKPCSALLPFRKKWIKYELYLISEDKSQNVNDAETVIEKRRKMTATPLKTIVFTQDRMSISILEDFSESSRRFFDDNNFHMIFIDEISLFCNDLIFRHPLYCLPQGRKDISVMIIGCGTWGAQMLKTVISNGQIEGYTLKIRAYDNRADDLRGLFFSQCPEIKNLIKDKSPAVDLEFVKADVMNDAFYDEIEKNNSDATYICVATSDDSINLVAAEKLYRFFRRKNGFGYTPPIYVRVKDDKLTENVSGKSQAYLQKRGIELFGTAKSFYAKRTLFNTKLEKLALAAHLVYYTEEGEESRLKRYKNILLSRADKKNREDICLDEGCKEAIDSFYASEINRRSSMATVLHFGAKIMSLCGNITDNGEITENILSEYEKRIKNKNNLESMERNEHDRWNFFTATEGWEKIDKDDIKKYYNGSHKDALSKSHPCLIEFDDLDALSDTYNRLKPEKTRNFKREDEKIILQLPEIIRFANENYGE